MPSRSPKSRSRVSRGAPGAARAGAPRPGTPAPTQLPRRARAELSRERSARRQDRWLPTWRAGLVPGKGQRHPARERSRPAASAPVLRQPRRPGADHWKHVLPAMPLHYDLTPHGLGLQWTVRCCRRRSASTIGGSMLVFGDALGGQLSRRHFRLRNAHSCGRDELGACGTSPDTAAAASACGSSRSSAIAAASPERSGDIPSDGEATAMGVAEGAAACGSPGRPEQPARRPLTVPRQAGASRQTPTWLKPPRARRQFPHPARRPRSPTLTLSPSPPL